jgi:hypothetical protein
MIGILDQIEIDADKLSAMQQLLSERYVPGAIARGMKLTRSWVSPPLALINEPMTLWVLWEVEHVGSWWNMRMRAAADPSVPAFWGDADKLCKKRDRHYLVDTAPAADAALLPAPVPLGTERLTTENGVRVTAQFFVHKNASAQDIAQWEQALRAAPQHIAGLQQVFLARNLEGSFGAGDYTADLHFIDAAAQQAASQQAYWRDTLQPLFDRVVEREWRMATQLIGGGMRSPNIKNGIKRTAYFRMFPGVAKDIAANWERTTLEMPAYMATMKNWSLSRALDDHWTYVWEQEFERVDDLLGEYMIHPHHWAYVDPWFDHEFKKRVIDNELSHAFCPTASSVLAWSLSK